MKYFFLFLLFCTSACFAGPFHPAVLYVFPRPDSKLLPREVTVILRLEGPYRDQMTSLQDFIQVYGESRRYSGSIFYATDNRTIIFKSDDLFDNGKDIRCVVKTSRFGLEDFEFEFTIVLDRPQTPDRLWKPAPEKVHFPLPRHPGQARLVNGVAVPDDFPTIRVEQTGETAPGRIFYAVNYPQEGTGNYLIVLNNDGSLYYYRKNHESVRSGNLTVHPTGVLSNFFYGPDYYRVVDRSFKLIDTYRAGHGYRTDNHELQILENGHALLIAEENVKIGMNAVVAGGKLNAVVQGNHFQELDTDHNVIFEWRSWDFYRIEDAVHENLQANYIDYVHMNSIAVDYDGHYVISARNLKEVTKIDRNTGEIIWRLGGRYNQFTYTNDNVEFSYQHDARPVEGKPGHYLIFDNGRNRDPYFSRSVEYKLDTVNMTAEKVWQYRPQPERKVPSMGSSQRLPNGNTLVDMPRGGELMAREVTPEGKVVFEVTSLGHSNYRCRRFEWSGMLDRPYLFVENYGAIVRLIFAKFGDENVDYFKIYYGKNSSTTAALDTTSGTYLDCSAERFTNMSEYYFSVSAVDHNGTESEKSDVAKVFIRYTGPGRNLIKNGTFGSVNGWVFERQGAAHARGWIDEKDRYKISITQVTSRARDVRLAQKDIILLNRKEYVFEFDAFADKNRPIHAKIEQKSPPYINYGRISDTYITTQAGRYTYRFFMENPSTAEAQVVFDCGQQTGTVYIDNVSLKYLATESDTSFQNVVNVNFQPDNEPVPDGYVADTGIAFGVQRNGFKYGWLDGENLEFRRRAGQPDARYATLNHLQKTDQGRIWEIELPNGSYRIFLVMGDGAYTDQINNIQIEGIAFNDPDGRDSFDEYAADVLIEDGRLTLSPGTGAENAKVCFIDIAKNDTAVDEENDVFPAGYLLCQNYPNPFNASTAIEYSLPGPGRVRLAVFNLLGRRIKTLIDGPEAAGRHTVIWDGTNEAGMPVAGGVYIYEIKANGPAVRKKMVLVR